MSAQRKTNQVAKAGQPQLRKWMPFLLKNFNIHAFNLDWEKDNEKVAGFFIAYPRHSGQNPIFQTEEFEITQYGIPKLGEYVKEDKDRIGVKWPLDPTQPGCVLMKDKFEEMDNYMMTNQKALFASHPVLKGLKSACEYSPVVRQPQTVEDELADPNKPKKEKCDAWKAKFDIDFTTGKVKTSVYVRETPDSKPERVQIETISDLEKYVKYRSRVKMIVMMNKMWVDKTLKNGAKVRKFGLGFKIMSIEVVSMPESSGGSYKDAMATYAFIDDSNQEQQEEAQEEEHQEEEHQEEEQDEEQQEEEVEEVEEVVEEVEEEPEPEPEPPKPEPVKPAAKGGRAPTKGKK